VTSSLPILQSHRVTPLLQKVGLEDALAVTKLARIAGIAISMLEYEALSQHRRLWSAGGWVVIDFGLARKFTSDDGCVVAARDKKEFRGSTSYASLAAHKLEDLGELPNCACCAVTLLIDRITCTFRNCPITRALANFAD